MEEQSLPNRMLHKDLPLIRLVSALALCEDEVEDRALKEAFYYHFHEKLFERVHKATFRLFSGQPDCEDIRDDIFQDTVIKAFEKVKGFRVNRDWSDKECKKVVLHWLGEIANNLLLKKRKTEADDKTNLDQYFYERRADLRQGSIGKTKYKPTYDRGKFDLTWKKLSPMARDILILCMEHGTIGKPDEENTRHLPDSVIKELMEKYGASQSSIRQTKSRALKAIKSCKIENDYDGEKEK